MLGGGYWWTRKIGYGCTGLVHGVGEPRGLSGQLHSHGNNDNIIVLCTAPAPLICSYNVIVMTTLSLVTITMTIIMILLTFFRFPNFFRLSWETSTFEDSPSTSNSQFLSRSYLLHLRFVLLPRCSLLCLEKLRFSR